LQQQLYLLNNFNGVTAMLAGLTSSPVFRLKFTWNDLPPKVRKIEETVENEMSSANSFKIYRELLKTRHPPLIPFLGIFLSDLTFTEEGNLNNTPDGLINWGKRTLLAGVLTRFKAQQLKANYNIEESPMKEWYEKTSPISIRETFPHLLLCCFVVLLLLFFLKAFCKRSRNR
jgi:son of sevenless-like protein